jgi:hypothetical protein
MNEVKALNVELCQIKASNDEAMTIEGYASVFGNVDSYGDVIEKGAFAKTLEAHKAAGTMPKMLKQHDAFSAFPIGKWTSMEEDHIGLKVTGKLFNTNDGRDAYEVLKEGGIDGLSIGFRPTEFVMRSKPEDPKRVLKSVDLLEVSVVTFPANGKARVLSVKSAGDIESIRDLETALAERGFSQAEAKAICSKFESKADVEARQAQKELLEALQAFKNTLKS